MPEPSTLPEFDPTTSSTSAPRQTGCRWPDLGRWFWMLVFATLVFGPVVKREFPRELARWHLAAAHVALDASQYDEALRLVNRALELAGPRPEYLLLRAEIYLRCGEQDRCEEDLDRAVEAAPPQEKIYVYQQRANLHLEMQRWSAAVRDWEAIEQLAQRPEYEQPAVPFHVIWNSLAYMRALANQELDKALEEINLALAQQPDNAAYLDTRGYIYYRLGHYNKALADLERAVELAHKEWRELEKQLQQLRDLRVDPRPIDRQRVELRRNYAVILYHRALVHDLFDEAKATQDYEEIRQLGFSPGPDLF
ncbi:MAG: hypothetical protein KatS3mg110_1007 [Pirellulaceae bacterium]|nr:MAG: hypothetical protein KatS3mg110_1007 [Pirellulaceae bacterium]